MNDENLLFLSRILEVLFVVSLIVAILTVWLHLRKKRAERLKDASTPSARLGSVIDEHKPD